MASTVGTAQINDKSDFEDILAQAEQLGASVLVDAAPFIGYNTNAGGYISDDPEWAAEFADWAKTQTLDVDFIEDDVQNNRFVLFGDRFAFAIPYGASLDYVLFSI